MKASILTCKKLLKDQFFITENLNMAILELIEYSYPNDPGVTLPIVARPIVHSEYLKATHQDRRTIDQILSETVMVHSSLMGDGGYPAFKDLVEDTLDSVGLIEYYRDDKEWYAGLDRYYNEVSNIYENCLPILLVGNVFYCIYLEGL